MSGAAEIPADVAHVVAFLDPAAAPRGIVDVTIELPRGGTHTYSNAPMQDVKFYNLGGYTFGVLVFVAREGVVT